jgi:hypothetical protein
VAKSGHVDEFVLLKQLNANLDGGLGTEGLIQLIHYVLKSVTTLVLDDVWPEVGLVVLEGVWYKGSFIKLFRRVQKGGFHYNNFPFVENFGEYMALIWTGTNLLHLFLRVKLSIIDTMVLCEFKNDRLIDYVLLQPRCSVSFPEDVQKIKAPKDDTVRAFSKLFVDHESVVHYNSLDLVDYAHLVSVLVGKLEQLLKLPIAVLNTWLISKHFLLKIIIIDFNPIQL